MTKSVQPGKPSPRPAPPPQDLSAVAGEVVANAEAILTSTTGTFAVTLQSKLGRQKEWSADPIAVNLEAISPEHQAKVVAFLIQKGLDAIAKEAATGKITIGEGDDKEKVDKDEAYVRKAVTERFAKFAQGETGAKTAKQAQGPIEREMLKMAKLRVAEFAKKQGWKLTDKVKTDKAKDLLATNVQYANALRALAARRIEEQKQALASIDLSGLGIEKVGTPSKPGTKKPKKVAKAEDLDLDDETE